jgi:hypothetical protein
MKSITKWKDLSPEDRFLKALYFDRRRYKELKESCSSMLKDAARVWETKAKLITKEDYEKRSLNTAVAGLGVTMLTNIRKAQKVRAESYFRHCTYTFGRYKNRYVYILNFYKISESRYKNNYLFVSKYQASQTKGEFSRSKPGVNLSKVIESGRYLYRQIFFTEFNLYFYPKIEKKYALKVYGNQLDNYTVYRY